MSIVAKIIRLLSPRDQRAGIVLIGLMAIGMLLEMLGVGLVIPAVALLMQTDVAEAYPVLRPVILWLGNPDRRTLVTSGVAGLVLVFAIKTIFLALLAWRQSRYVFGVQAELSQRLFSIYLRQPYTFLLHRNSAQLTRNAITEVGQFAAHALTPVLVLVTELLVLLGLTVLLVAVEPIGATVVMVVSGATAAVFHRATRERLARWGAARQAHEGARLQHLQQGLGGAKDIKLLGREEEFLERYQRHNSATADISTNQMTLAQLPRLGLELLAIISLALLVAAMLFQGRELPEIVPALGLFAVAAYRILPSVNRGLGAAQSLRFAHPIVELLGTELTLSEDARLTTQHGNATFEDRIELENVAYRYPGAAGHALDGLSVTIARGESVGFIGPSGSGKTTLVDVLLGLLPPTAGSISVDGRSIQNHLRAWQDRVGYVPQEIYLTDDTLRRNVAFGLADGQIDQRAVQRAIVAARLEEFVASLPDGLDTLVGERGVRLSGGQRQRIGIARSLYHDPEVLVLDEATSSLDVTIEREIMDAVSALHRQKTLVIIAHRLSTVERCDRIYRLEQGRVAETGRPSEILGLRPAS